MSSKPGEPRGEQRPRSIWVPPYETSTGAEAFELCQLANLNLDPWQAFILGESLGERSNRTWAAMEVGVEVSRQNGKGGLLEARQLTGLYILEEPLQVHSAHLFDTSLEAFRRLKTLIEECPDLDREVMRIVQSHGEEGIELRGKRRIRFRTRTSGGGRGLSGDCLYLDEAMYIKQATHGALFPIMAARPNPQLWYTGSAVDQDVHEDGRVFAKVRERGLAGNDPRLAWFGFGEPSDEITPDSDEAAQMLDDPDAWARANPALGIRISKEYIEAERRALSARNFAVERLGIGDWPSTAESEGQVIPAEAWSRNLDEKSELADPVVFALDVSPDRRSSSIGAADADGHLELIDRKRGVGWLIDRSVELAAKWKPSAIVIDGGSPAASLIDPLKEALRAAGLDPDLVYEVDTGEYVEACVTFYDAVEQDGVQHLNQAELNAAVQGAATRPLRDSWAWSRKKSDIDITPLVAVTLARWKAAQGEEVSVYEERGVVVL